jgi:hypothetical protein
VKPTRAAGVEISIDVRKKSLIRLKVLAVMLSWLSMTGVLCPDALIGRDADKVETERRQEIERALVGWGRLPARRPGKQPLKVESVVHVLF